MKRVVLTATTILVSVAAQTASAVNVNVALASKPAAFVTQPVVKARLTSLMGLVNARFLQKNFGTVSTLQRTAQTVAVTGCRPHDCANNGSLVVYDVRHDAFKVWLTVNGKTRVFQNKAFAAPLNADVTAYIKNM